MKAYRIRHIKTGLYYQPSNNGMNISSTGKIYSNKNGWNAFERDRYLRINRLTTLGKKIADGEIVIGDIHWPRDTSNWDLSKPFCDLPDDRNAKKFGVFTDPSEWEQEFLTESDEKESPEIWNIILQTWDVNGQECHLSITSFTSLELARKKYAEWKKWDMDDPNVTNLSEEDGCMDYTYNRGNELHRCVVVKSHLYNHI